MDTYNKAYQFRIYPNEEQRVLLAKTFGSVRLVYNHYLDIKIKVSKGNQESVSYYQCAKDLVAFKKKCVFKRDRQYCFTTIIKAFRYCLSKFLPCSKTCSACGAIKKSLTLSERTYVCDCGAILDRDINAAINIKGEGIRMLGLQ